MLCIQRLMLADGYVTIAHSDRKKGSNFRKPREGEFSTFASTFQRDFPQFKCSLTGSNKRSEKELLISAHLRLLLTTTLA